MTDEIVPTEPRRLPVDLDELETAMAAAGLEQRYFLDLETGAVLGMGTEAIVRANRLLDEQPPECEITPELIDELIESSGLADWEAEELRVGIIVSLDFGGRYVEFEAPTSSERFHDMVDLAAGVTDEGLRRRLENALGGRGSFRRFKDIVDEHPEVRPQWFAFRDTRERAYILEWLFAHGVEPTNLPDGWPSLTEESAE